MASARTDHRGYFIDLEQVPHQGWRVAAITHRVNGRALSPPAFSYPDRETAAQYGRPQHHLRPFERAPATSAVHLKADIRLHANIRPGGPCADLCNAANYCLGLLGSPSLCEAVALLAQAPYITFAVAPSCSAISHVRPRGIDGPDHACGWNAAGAIGGPRVQPRNLCPPPKNFAKACSGQRDRGQRMSSLIRNRRGRLPLCGTPSRFTSGSRL